MSVNEKNTDTISSLALSKMFHEYQETKDTGWLDKAVAMVEKLCTNNLVSIEEKFSIFVTCIKYDREDTYKLWSDVICRWRDILAMKYIQTDMRNNIVTLLTNITRCSIVPSHDRLTNALCLYNCGYIDICYDCFEFVALDEGADIAHRTEAAKFLFANQDHRSTALKCLLTIIANHSYTNEVRYKAILAYTTNKAIRTTYNADKLYIPFDQHFAFPLQYAFFSDHKNDVYFRILSAQTLLQMSVQHDCECDEESRQCDGKHITTDIQRLVVASLFEISNDTNLCENQRADAADVILRLGNSFERARARELITKIGYSCDGTKRKLHAPNTMYDNSQNVHNETIDECVQTYLLQMVEKSQNCEKNKESQEYTYKSVETSVSNFIRETFPDDNVKRNAAYQALNRIGMDTATFTTLNITLAEILIHVWSHINEFSAEIVKDLKLRLLDELVDMNDTCSSGHAARFVNVLSTVDDTLRISWLDQMRGNVKGRINAMIRDCPDAEIQMNVALGMMDGATDDEQKVYLDFVKTSFVIVEKELYDEFVGQGYIKETDFYKYILLIRKEWAS